MSRLSPGRHKEGNVEVSRNQCIVVGSPGGLVQVKVVPVSKFSGTRRVVLSIWQPRLTRAGGLLCIGAGGRD